MQPVEARRRQHLQEQFLSLQTAIASTATYLHRPWEDLDLALASERSPSPMSRSAQRNNGGESLGGLDPEGEEDDELGGWIDGDKSIGDVDDDVDVAVAPPSSSLQLAEYVAEMTKRVCSYAPRIIRFHTHTYAITNLHHSHINPNNYP